MDTIPRSGDANWRRRVIAHAVLLLSLPVVLPLLFVAYTNWVPPYGAKMTIPALRAEVALRFFYIWDESSDNSGRYLTISTPAGRKTIAMTAFDWAHNSRTSIYQTADGAIAILGPMGDDYVVSPKTMKVDQRYMADSESWTYLGAFDFGSSDNVRVLRFFSSDEQLECIPMIGGDITVSQARLLARRTDCRASAAAPNKSP
jgi:hypothetical protein